jgi:hypothetical protein
MIKRAFILAVIITTSAFGGRTVSSLNGTVKTSTNTPLKDVIVTLAGHPKIADTTDAKGLFSLNFLPT